MGNPQRALSPHRHQTPASPGRQITVIYETMQLNTDEGLTMAVYTAEPGSASQQALDILASWSATSDQATPPAPPTNSDQPSQARQFARSVPLFGGRRLTGSGQ